MKLLLQTNSLGASPKGVQVKSTSTAFLGFDTAEHNGTPGTYGSVLSADDPFVLIPAIVNPARAGHHFDVSIDEATPQVFTFNGTQALMDPGTSGLVTHSGTVTIRFDEDPSTDQIVTVTAPVGWPDFYTVFNGQLVGGYTADPGDNQLGVYSSTHGTKSRVRIVAGTALLLADLGLSVGVSAAGMATVDKGAGPVSVNIGNVLAAQAAEVAAALGLLGLTGATINPATGTSTGPVISGITPLEGGTITPTTPVQFSVTDSVLLRRIVVTARFAGLAQEEIVHDGSTFGPTFSTSPNSRVGISGGYTYTILRTGGWPAGTAPQIKIIAVDAVGNETVRL